MSRKKEFLRELNQLFELRTGWLRSVIGDKRPGPLATFTRKDVNDGIAQLQSITSDAFVTKLAKQEFTKHAPTKRAWRVKGHGDERKRELFDVWFEKKLGDHQKCVYVFWGQKRKCIYVGRTSGGKNRPRSHFDKGWFRGVKRIDIYPVRLASQLPKLECLAIHRFWPKENKQRAAREKWTKKCPMCRIHREIHREVRRIFRLK